MNTLPVPAYKASYAFFGSSAVVAVSGGMLLLQALTPVTAIIMLTFGLILCLAVNFCVPVIFEMLAGPNSDNLSQCAFLAFVVINYGLLLFICMNRDIPLMLRVGNIAVFMVAMIVALCLRTLLKALQGLEG